MAEKNKSKRASDVRAGKRKNRQEKVGSRIPKLGYYLIVTDTKETEKNYFLGLKNSIPEALKDHITLRIERAKSTKALIARTLELIQGQSQYLKPWIIFDRDEVIDFDRIISDASNNGIQAGWSNPCFEIWFLAYFGIAPTFCDSQNCWKQFAELYRRKMGREYSKSDVHIFEFLNKFGDSEKAIRLCEERYTACIDRNHIIPSKADSVTTVCFLVREIVEKIEKV